VPLSLNNQEGHDDLRWFAWNVFFYPSGTKAIATLINSQ